MQPSEKTAAELLRIEAVRLQPDPPFTWASGRRAPIYTDNRLALSDTALRRHIIDRLVALSQKWTDIEGIVGVATAGIAHGVLLADRLDVPFAYVRSKAKAHGRQNQIEGRVEKGQRVIVVEDLVSTGGSALAAVEALRAAGVTVLGVLAIFTYGFRTAAAAFAAADCPLYTLTDYDTLLQVAERDGFLEQQQRQVVQKWRTDPMAWSRERGGS